MSDDLLARLREAAEYPGIAYGAYFSPEQVQRGLERVKHDMDLGADYYDAICDSFVKGVR